MTRRSGLHRFSGALALTLVLACGAAPPPERTTTPTTDARPADQGALSRLSRLWPDGSALRYAIRWTSPGTTWLYDGTLTLLRDGALVRGTFEWRLVSANATMPELASRVGSTAVEEIAGTYDPSLDAILLRTVSISDPTLVGAASYRLSVSREGLQGTTAGAEDGIWDGVLVGTPPPR